jgi:multiple antibiotic resistance protein
MSVMITLASERSDWLDRLWLVASSVTVSSMIAITLWMAVPVDRVLGKTGINVVTRVMALIVAALGVKFIMTGIKNEIPGLVV